MARRFSLREPLFDIPTINYLEMEWAGAAEKSLAREIGFQDQFRQLYRHLFTNLESVPADNPDWALRPLSLSVRAGAIKTYVLLSVSIAEGALSALGEEHGLGRRAGDLYRKPFGALLGAWSDGDVPRAEVAGIWDDLQLLLRYRNFIHLNRAAGDDEGWQGILNREQEILGAADRAIDHLKELCHVFRDP